MVAIINYVGNLVIIIHDNYFQSYTIYLFLNFPFVCCIYNLHFGFVILIVVVWLCKFMKKITWSNNPNFHDVDQFHLWINFFFVKGIWCLFISNLICDLQVKIIHYHWVCIALQDKYSISSHETLLHFFLCIFWSFNGLKKSCSLTL